MEHGIAFNMPHFKQATLPYAPLPRKLVSKISGQNAYPSSQDETVALIPLAVIGECVFCISIEINKSTAAHIWEPPTYQGGAPTPAYESSQEGVAYFQLPKIKEFIDQWKLID